MPFRAVVDARMSANVVRPPRREHEEHLGALQLGDDFELSVPAVRVPGMFSSRVETTAIAFGFSRRRVW
jgi:hypothetical protein